MKTTIYTKNIQLELELLGLEIILTADKCMANFDGDIDPGGCPTGYETGKRELDCPWIQVYHEGELLEERVPEANEIELFREQINNLELNEEL